jgi:hypothetical protein
MRAVALHRPFCRGHCVKLVPRRPTAQAQPKTPSTGPIDQEVFENERAFATMKRAAAFAASKLLVRQRLIRFDAHELVLRAAVRASERRYFGDWHGVG